MIAQPPASMICFPPAALNGGPLESAPAKVGEWVWQPKVDDWRAVVHTPTGTVWNQYGKLSSITDKFSLALDRVLVATHGTGADWLDVGMMENRHDLMRGCIIVFDWMTPAKITLQQRREVLSERFETLQADVSTLLAFHGGRVHDRVFLINQWESHVSPIECYAWCKIENGKIGHKFFEGLVAKRADSLYTFSRKPKQVTPDWVKHRFDQGGQS